MRTPIVLGLLAVSSIAHADRTTVLDVGATFGAVAPVNQDSADQAIPLVGPRVTLGFESSFVEMPDHPGYNFAGALVPELVAGAYIEQERAEGYVGVGLRAEVQMGQREQGLLKVSARGAMYVVARALVIGGDRDPMYELGFGEYLSRFHTRDRVGIELTFVDRPHDHGSVESEAGGFFGLYVGR